MIWTTPTITSVLAPAPHEALTGVCPPLGSAEILELDREERLRCWRENGQPEGGGADN